MQHWSMVRGGGVVSVPVGHQCQLKDADSSDPSLELVLAVEVDNADSWGYQGL